MKKIKKQDGAVSVIAVFILIVVIASMVTVSLNMSRSSLSDSNLKNNSAQATYLAESALERLVFKLNDDPDCNNLVTPDQQTLGNGTFEISSISITTANSDCDVQVKAKVNGVVKYINANIINNGGTGGAGTADYQFTEHFDFVSWVPWTQVNTAQSGTSSATNVDIEDCPTATCTVSTATVGAYNIHTESKQANIVGYIEKTVSISIGPTARTGTANLIGMKYLATTAGGNSPFIISLELVDSTGTTATLNLVTENKKNITSWTAYNSTVTFPANATYDRVRINYDLTQANKTGTVDVWVDEVDIFIPAIAGGAAPNWQIMTWQEVSN